MEKSCFEQFLSDVIRVKLVPASACSFAVPFQIGGLTSISGTIGEPALQLSYSGGDADEGEYEQAPTLKQSERREPAGIIVQHELQVPVTAGFSDVRRAVAQLQHKDFHLVLDTSDGESYVCYALPNSSQVLLDEQGTANTATVKVTLQSMSHCLLLQS